MPAKKKAAETAAPAKTTTRKTTRKPAVKSVVTIQYAGKEIDQHCLHIIRNYA